MKRKPIIKKPFALFILLTIFCTYYHLTLGEQKINDSRYQTKKLDQLGSIKGDIISGDKLFIRDNGLICKNLRTGTLLANKQLSFNNKGCNPLLVKRTKEKNLLNLRSTLCFACPPRLTCTLDKTCGTGSSPIVGCLDISSSLSHNSLKVCSGFGIAPQQATVFVSGTGCPSQIASLVFVGLPFDSIDLTSSIQIEICIPIFFCTKFCDRPIIHVTYNKNTFQSTGSCVKDRIISAGAGTPCFLSGNSVTTFLGASIHVQKISCKSAFVKFQLLYQNCIGISADTLCLDELRAETCSQQKLAVEDICAHANLILNSACFDIAIEGPVL